MFGYWLTGASALAFVVSAAQAAPLAADARAFGVRENVHSMSISPSGAKVAMLTSGPGSETVLTVADLTTGQTLNLTKSDGKPQSLRWCEFAGETQLVCRHSGIEEYDQKLVGFSGLLTIRIDGQNMKSLRQKGNFEEGALRQNDGSIIDWLPGQEGAVLMSRTYVADVGTTGSILGKSKHGLGVDRIDLATLKSSTVEQPNNAVGGYMTDGRGHVRLEMLPDFNRGSVQQNAITKIRYRTATSDEWRDLGAYNGITNEGFYPLAVDATSNSLYALKKTSGRNALYRVALDGSGASTLVGSNPVVDIDGVVRVGEGQRVIGYTFADDSRQVVYFDPEYDRLQKSFAKALPDRPQISFEGGSADGQMLLIFASGDTQPGTFYRFDKRTKKLEEIAAARPDLAGRALAKVTAIRVPGSDGTSIPAYLTLPPGSEGKKIPAVVLPHGGPSARDEWGFDWLPQFLAARGYAVIQPNFRGSAGYGDEYSMDNVFKSWRTAIGDITASARHLVAQGIADPDKLAIVGWSYGGYAALQSAAVEPNLYKAVIAVAPVTDLNMLMDESKGFTNEQLVRERIGTGPHLVAGSPLQNVSAIKAPVLLVHGNRDANVGFAQSEAMYSALRGQGKNVEFLRFDNLDHQLDDSNARVKMLNSIGSLLQRAFGA